MRLVVIAGAVGLLVGCTASATPPRPVVAPTPICPPDPPAGSNLICAPPKACEANPLIQELNNGPLGALLPEKYRAAIYHSGLVVQDLCAP